LFLNYLHDQCKFWKVKERGEERRAEEKRGKRMRIKEQKF
jgi:hypothetical protein